MSLMVLDASVVAGWALPTQYTEAAGRLLREARAHRFLAPSVFPIEVRNLFLAAERREKWRISETVAGLELIRQLNVIVSAPLLPVDMDRALRIARAERLSMYDGLYLHLAIESFATLASRDAALVAAAERRGVDVYDARATEL